jgi:hypothetical protein
MIEIKFDFASLDKYMKNIENTAFEKSTRWATNKAIQAANDASDKNLHKKYGLNNTNHGGRPSLSDIRRVRKISRKDIGLGIGAKIFGDYKPINLIHFVMGGKNPSAQKTVSMRLRRRVYVRMESRTHHLKSTFLGRDKRTGLTHAFSRLSRDGKLIRQTLPNPHSVMTRKFDKKDIKSLTREVFLLEFAKKLSRTLKEFD